MDPNGKTQSYTAPVIVANYSPWQHGGIRVKLVPREGFRLLKVIPRYNAKRALPLDEGGLDEAADDSRSYRGIFHRFNPNLGWTLTIVVEKEDAQKAFGARPPVDAYVDILE